jgi:hypothetical protein
MIPINMQKEDANHYFVHSKFLANGGTNCGYLLKPPWLQSKTLESQYSISFTKPLYHLLLKVHAGQKLILVNTDSPAFFLNVYLRGTRLEEERNKHYNSGPKTEGFYSEF